MNDPVVADAVAVYLISLGCSKNLVDSENMSGILTDHGYTITLDPLEAEVIVVNTCGFLQSAVREAIDMLLEMADYKVMGSCDFLIVTGCMSQRYANEIQQELPEVDAILGTKSYFEIADVLNELYQKRAMEAGSSTVLRGEAKAPPLIRRSTAPEDALRHLSAKRPVSTGPYAYLKVSEGCDKGCAYCAIPGIRGGLCSRPMSDLVAEANYLAQIGIKEVILIAQDTTAYGLDRYGERRLAQLIREIAPIKGIERIRFLYAYANGMTDELLSVMREESKVVQYVDLPIQHASDSVLRAMNRADTREFLTRTFSHIRKALPDCALRTTVMVGFPGETEQDFEELCDFVREIEFDHLGAFVFSPEEGTRAFKMRPLVAESKARRRSDTIMEIQRAIVERKNLAKIGQSTSVLIESVSDDGIFYIGRAPFQAPEVDPVTYVASPIPLKIGAIHPVTIVDHFEYDLTGVLNYESSK